MIDNKAFKAEKAKLKKIFKNMATEKKELLDSLIDRAAYMMSALSDMENQISEDGLVQDMPQGEYSIQRAHPLLSPYNSMVKNYNSTIKQLSDMLPNIEQQKAGSALMNFALKK